MRIFVTGGAGYVGSHCCKRFAEAGWEVIVYDNLSRGWRENAKWGPLIEGDILDQGKLKNALVEHKPDIVAHFAAFAYVGESVTHPGLYFHNNVVGSLNLLEAMRGADVTRLIFSSTCASYGLPERLPIDEEHPQRPINPYGWSKLFVERMIDGFALAHGLSAVTLRYFNAGGCDPGGEIGESHLPETHAIPLAIAAALGGEPFNVLGTDFDTDDGTAIRDYIHVCDLAEAHLAAANYLATRAGMHAFNLGTGRGTSVLQLLDAVATVSGRHVPARICPRRPGDPPVLVAGAMKALADLQWQPQCSDIATIVETALEWQLARGRP